ncbi:ficolin-2 [Elysia marginata]|uniref:Ficolin-2 n=1 Tax=Elysia marginata TaxID=1093978 RepID=A0AAV4EZX9_9GAST|nr:ficolin-2 [Elysia marginata]
MQAIFLTGLYLSNFYVLPQRRVKGDVKFYRTWQEYKEGFGDPSGDFWLGNEALHSLTGKHAYELRIDMTVDGKHTFAKYSTFQIENESDK